MSGLPASLVEQAVFVYGEFSLYRGNLLAADFSPEPPARKNLLAQASSPEPPVAIEILREFGPQEFIGKVYVLRERSWRPVPPEGASSFGWYQTFQNASPVYFDMRGSGLWEVEWFRFESSARSPNPYVAVALKKIEPESVQK